MPVDLKKWLHGNISRLQKLLLVLATFEQSAQVREIRVRAAEGGLHITKGWNVSSILSGSKGLAIRTPSGWEITDAGIEHLGKIGVSPSSSAERQIASDLRAQLDHIANPHTKAFVDEAIKCYEAHLHRSAIVMSWLAAIDVLKRHVVANHLDSFNVEAQRINSKWKKANTADDIGRMRESDFLDRIAALSIIGKNVKDELKVCLQRRNGCGHPNSLRIGTNVVTHHIEVLLLNVFTPFSA